MVRMAPIDSLQQFSAAEEYDAVRQGDRVFSVSKRFHVPRWGAQVVEELDAVRREFEHARLAPGFADAVRLRPERAALNTVRRRPRLSARVRAECKRSQMAVAIRNEL